jgi:hypothetical protein
MAISLSMDPGFASSLVEAVLNVLLFLQAVEHFDLAVGFDDGFPPTLNFGGQRFTAALGRLEFAAQRMLVPLCVPQVVDVYVARSCGRSDVPAQRLQFRLQIGDLRGDLILGLLGFEQFKPPLLTDALTDVLDFA